MTWLVQSRLLNDPFSDPGIYLDVRFGRRALLFDLGDLGRLSAREVMRVSDAFVSHTHMDHFGGFDRLLRLCLHRPAPLRLVGPPGFVDQVEHRLRSYTWNLLGPDAVDFRLAVHEVEANRIARSAEFRAREALRRRGLVSPVLAPGCILDEEAFRIETVALDHGIPSLAFALVEPVRVNVLQGALEARGLPVGPWLAEAKRAARRGAPDETRIAVTDGATASLGALRETVLRLGPGQKVAYVTDAADTPENAARIVALAQGADHLFIEAAFLEADREVAARTRHLTAARAGALARAAGARRLTTFHHSARYLERPGVVEAEARAAFRGEGPTAAVSDERT